MNPVIISLGPFQVHWYGVLIVLGAVVGAYIATIEARRRGEDPEHVWNVLIWVLILGIIGARLYHVFSNPVGGVGWSYYREHPLDAINFWSGGFRGLGIYGAIIGGLIAVVVYCWRKQLNLLRWLDIIIPGLLVGQAIGRFGNFVNQELFGPPTTLPWGFKINPAYPFQTPTEMLGATREEVLAYVAVTRFHPTFFYEALWNFVGFVLVMVLGRKLQRRLREGDIFFFYLIWYPLGRFWVEMFRPDAWVSGLGNLATAQVIALIGMAIGVVALIVRHIGWRPEPAAAPSSAESEP